MMTDFLYGASDEEMFHDNFEDALSDLINGDCSDDPYSEWVGQTVGIHRAEKFERSASYYFRDPEVSNIIDMLQENAYDDVGESAETFAQDFKRDAFLRYVREWLDDNLECPFIGLRKWKVIERTITEEAVDRALL